MSDDKATPKQTDRSAPARPEQLSGQDPRASGSPTVAPERRVQAGRSPLFRN